MIALKIMASGSPYLAVNSRMVQSSMSPELPLNSGGRPVCSGSGAHPPASTGEEPPTPPALVLSGDPLHPVETSRLAASAAINVAPRGETEDRSCWDIAGE